VCGSLPAAASRETSAEQLQPDCQAQVASKRPAGFEVEGLSCHLPAVERAAAARALRPDCQGQVASKQPAGFALE
jgi:hypothetical protein